jgi:hypothetical protein
MSQVFQVLHCPQPHGSPSEHVQGYFLLNKLRECSSQLSNFSKDLETVELAQSIGPDEFLFTLEGPALLTLQQVHLGECKYRFDYELAVPGDFVLTLWRVRDRYLALNELDGEHPMFYQDKVFADGFKVTLGNPELSKEMQTNILSSGSLPVCPPRSFRQKAQWIFSGDLETLWLETPWVNHLINNRTWYVERSAYEWRGLECEIPHYTSSQVAECVAGKRVKMTGDSHVRVLFNQFMASFCGVPSAAIKRRPGDQCSPCQDKPGEVCFVSNILGERDPILNESHPDMFLINFGQHFIAGGPRRHNSIQSYLRHFEQAMNEFSSGLDHSSLLWMTTLDFPLRRDQAVVSHRDWRTTPRIRIMRDSTIDVLKTKIPRWAILDGFQLSTSMTQAISMDDVHFHEEWIQMHLVHYVADFLCRP